ncbi:regulatory protein Rha [Alteromonas sp. I10]|nr:regulatory protein Rha [Alteromonas sp. I10]
MNLKHTMTSREIAELTNKEHGHVMRDVRSMLTKLGKSHDPFLDYEKSSRGRLEPLFRLDRDLTMTLVTKYDTARRYAVVRRWRELEGRFFKRQMLTYEYFSKTRSKLMNKYIGALVGIIGCVMIGIENWEILIGVLLIIWGQNISAMKK